MFKKHGFKILIIAGILMIAAYAGYELLDVPWVFGTDEEVNARVLPDPTMPPGVNVIISTPPPDFQSSIESNSMLTQNGVEQLGSSLYASGSPSGGLWFMPERIPLASMPEVQDMTGADDVWLMPESEEDLAQDAAQEQTSFAEDALIQIFEPEEAAEEIEEETEDEETVEIMGTIKIPRLDLSEMIYTGTGKESLKLGIGYIEESELPNEPGNMIIAAHRSSNNAAPFKHLDRMKVGDFIELKHWYRTYWYEVFEVIVVDKEEVWVLDDIEGMDYALTMVTCDPYIYFGGNRPRRLIVRAQLKYIDEPVIENGVVVE